MKKVYSKSSRQGLPGGPNEMFQKVKGIIVSERGQWDFPGMNTLVPTQDGRITMRGVPYPVLGQDETGYTQMMYPEQEYQFPGQNVLELPMAQNGLSTPIINLPEYTVIDEKIPENIRLANTAKRLVEELYDVSRPAAGFTEKISDLFIPGEKKYYDNTCVKGVCDIFKEANLNSGIPEDVLNNKDFLENYSKYGFTLVPNEQLQVGDIIQYYEKDRPTHLGIYVGDDEYVGDGSKDKPLVKSNIHKYPDGKDKLPFRAFRKNFKSGGSLPKAQNGPPTYSDSLELYKNTVALENFLRSKNATVPKDKFRRWQWEDSQPLVGTNPARNWYTLNPNLSDREKALSYANSLYNVDKSTGSKSLPKSHYIKTQNNLIGTRDWAPEGEDDKDFPVSYIHPQIKPQFEGDVDDMSGVAGSFYMYRYDPIAIKPGALLTPKELAIRLKKYGKRGIPQSKIDEYYASKNPVTPLVTPPANIIDINKPNQQTSRKEFVRNINQFPFQLGPNQYEQRVSLDTPLHTYMMNLDQYSKLLPTDSIPQQGNFLYRLNRKQLGGSLPKVQNGEELFPGEGMYYQIPEYTFDYKRRFSDLPTPRYTGPLMSQQLIDEATQREYEQRRRAIDESIAATRNPLSAERLAKESATTGDKLSLQMMFGDPYNSPRVYEALGGLDFINPAVMLGDMVTGLGSLPYNIQEGNYGSAALGLGAPLATGALASIGVKSPRGFVNNLVNPFAGIGDTPRQIPGSPNAVSVVDDVSRVVADTPQPWQMQELPGLHLKSTMTEGPISKIVEPKTGLINTEQALAIIGKESGGADKVALIRQGLGENIPKKMDYNDFRKTVQDQLIPLERQFSEQASNYGVGRLGYPSPKRSSYEKAIEHNQNMIEHYKKQIAAGSDNSSLKGDLQNAINNLENSKKELATLPLENQTLILGNKSKFGRGSSAHGNPEETLGHAHFLRDAETPDVLTVTQIQSDAFQGTHRTMPKSKESLLKDIETGWATDEGIENFTQKQLLDKNHQERFLQELVDYAASRGDINKMRLPTSETAAKVQNYDKIKPVTDPVEIAKIKRQIEAGKKRAAEAPTKDKEKWERGVRSLQLELNGGYEFQHQTILKKYSEQPKTIKKLFGKEPRIVTDSKGNTWYEFDIPEKFKQGKGEIKAYQRGGDTYNMQRALELGYTPDETSHWPSVDSTNGMWLKSTQHPTAWMESMYGYQLNPEVYKNYNIVYNPEGYFGDNQLQYVEKSQEYKIGGPLQTDPVLNFITQQQPRRFSKSKK